MEQKVGNYIGKIIQDYTIVDKFRENNRMRYIIKCSICGAERKVSNIGNNIFLHGEKCLGKKRKIGSKKIGEQYGDYIVCSKEVINNRSAYTIKCTICNSIKTVYNLREEKHSEYCNNFTSYIIGNKIGDYIIKKAYREERIYIDCECLKCGAKRNHIAYKDFKNNKNEHSKICTIKNLEKYPNKNLISKLLRTYQNMNTRIRINPAYKDVKNNFIDSVDFVTYVYSMYEKRLKEGKTLEELSIDRINPFGNYEKGNVRCLTISEQQYNKRSNYNNVETIENSLGEELVEYATECAETSSIKK